MTTPQLQRVVEPARFTRIVVARRVWPWRLLSLVVASGAVVLAVPGARWWVFALGTATSLGVWVQGTPRRRGRATSDWLGRAMLSWAVAIIACAALWIGSFFVLFFLGVIYIE